MPRRPLLLLVLVSLLTIGCTAVTAPSAPPSGMPSVAPMDDSIPVCQTIPITAAPEEAYRDRPIYVANEMPTEEIQAWAQRKPGFEDLWIDREHGGWVTVAFSTDAEARQAELATEFPGVGVVVVAVDWDKSALQRLQQRVSDALGPQLGSFSVGIDVLRGKVDIGIGVLSPERIAAVRTRFAGEPVCVFGLDPRVAIPEAQQPTSGDGWRLLASEDTGDVYRTDIATDRVSYGALWQRIGLIPDPPRVDFGSEVVVWFGAVYGSSCPNLRLDDVVVDLDRRLIHGRIVVPTVNGGCSDDANPRAYVVAVERTTLPPPPFSIQLGPDDPPAGAPEERTIVEADLREAGAVAGPGDVHGDPNLPEPWVVESGSVIEPDFEVPYRLSTRCGAEWLGRLNDVSWRTEVPSDVERFVPREWDSLVVDDAMVVSVLLQTGPEPTITATAAGRSIVYRPTLEPLPDCP